MTFNTFSTVSVEILPTLKFMDNYTINKSNIALSVTTLGVGQRKPDGQPCPLVT